MRLRIAVCLSLFGVLSCARRVEPPRSTDPSQVDHAIRVNGFAIDVKGRAPAVPQELEAAEDAVPPAVSLEPGAAVVGSPRAAVRAAKPGPGAADAAKWKKWLIQFDGPIHEADKASVEALGARLGDYLPEFAFVASMDDATRARAEKLPFVRGVVRYKPAYKISRHLKDESGAVRSDLGSTAKVRVRVDTAEGLPALLSEVHGRKGKVDRVSKDIAQVEVAPAHLAPLAQLEEVLWIEEVLPLELVNDTSRWTIQSYVPGSTPMSDGGLDGSGEIVGIGDTGLDYDGCYFRDPSGAPVGLTHRKVAGYVPFADGWDNDFGHGTHVSGTVAGDQAPITGLTTANGMAPRARVFMTDISPGDTMYVYPPNDLGDLFRAPYDVGARIHSNSWGAGYNYYETYAWSLDRFTWEHKDFLPLFANGNGGAYALRVGFPATAKNVISVGATENGARAENLAYFSSPGPAWDGRLKPTLAAPGVFIVSADSDGLPGTNNCGTVTMSGTSMATPTAAGAATLVRQYYGNGFWPSGLANPADAFAPSAALVKATLVNSAQEMTGDYTLGPIPSIGQGWGRINLSNTLRFAADSRFLDVADVQPGIVTGSTWSKQFFANGGPPLKVTLVWTDYPGAPYADVELVNDLDLEVVSPDGSTTYLGNAFADGASVAGGSADRLNVEEQILIPVSERGNYTVRVKGYNVPFGPQPFAVVVTGAGGVQSRGYVAFDRQRYGAATTIEVKVADRDLNVRPDTRDEALVTVRSDADPDGEVVRLVETGADTGVFLGTLPTGHAPGKGGDGVLAVTEGAVITATYLDANDGTGAPATVTATAVGDLTPPIISGVTVTAVRQGSAQLAWATNEPSSASVLFGKTPALGATVSTRWLTTSEAIEVGGLEEGTTYFYAAQATDEAGNITIDDAGGALRTFTTAVLPPDVSAHSSRGTVTPLGDTVVFGTALDPSGVASLLVNGVAVPVRAADGYFETTVPLAAGENRIVITATDGRGQTGTTTLVVTRLPWPDLIVTSVTAPEVAGLGMGFPVSAQICNVGAGDVTVDYIEVAWFLSEDDVLGPGAVYLTRKRIYSPLATGTCTTWQGQLSAGSTVFLGKRYRVFAMALVGQDEEHDDNNDRGTTTWLTFEPPDLTVSAVSAPPRVATQVPFDVTTTVTNIALGQAVGVTVDVYLSSDDTITTADRDIAMLVPATVNGGASVTNTMTVTLPSDIPPGTYRLGAIVDPRNQTIEKDETNNALAGALIVVDAPDLQVTSVSGPSTAPTGGTITVHDTVTARPTGGGAGPFTVGIYLSPDPVITTADARLGERTVASLTPGASSSGDTAITIPTGWPGGTYYIGAIADWANKVVETDETNNAAVGNAITVVGPDLVAAALTAPASLVVGQTVGVEETVAASAAGGNAPPVDVAIYLSTDPIITPSDTLLGWRSVPALAPGSSSTATTTVTIPASLAPGTYYLGVIVDDFSYCYEDQFQTQHCVGGDVAKEPDEANNVRVSGPIVIGGTDLTITELSAAASSGVGLPLVVHDTVAAAGGGTGYFRVGYYLSTDATITTSDTFLGSRAVSSLPPGGSSTADTTLTLPTGLPPGTYYLGAIADDQHLVSEASETNNTRATAIVLAGPDLIVSAVSGPASAGTGTPFDVTTTVANIGAGASAASTVSIYLSKDPVITTSDVLLGTRSFGTLAPGATSAGPTTVSIPSNLAAGTYYLGAIVDAANGVKESDESNNALAGNVVTLSVPDLTVDAVAGPAAAATGGTIVVSYTLSALANGAGASSATIGFYLSTDPVITPQDILLGSQLVGALAPGASRSGKVTLTIPTGIAGATYYLGAYANPSGSTVETDPTNNGLAGNVIQITGPDLVATAVSGPASAARGTSISVASTVAASAAGGAAPGFYVGLFLSTDATITSSDQLLGYRWVPALAPGATSSETTVVSLPAGLAPGTYYLGVIADDFPVCEWNWGTDSLECTVDTAKESDETNNALAGGTIVVTAP
jgi:subtilase family serine protease